MTAAASATEATAQVVFGIKDHQPVIEIKIARQDFIPDRSRLGRAMEFRYAMATDARFTPQIDRHPGEQQIRNFHFLAPTRAFVNGAGTEPAPVRLAT